MIKYKIERFMSSGIRDGKINIPSDIWRESYLKLKELKNTDFVEITIIIKKIGKLKKWFDMKKNKYDVTIKDSKNNQIRLFRIFTFRSIDEVFKNLLEYIPKYKKKWFDMKDEEPKKLTLKDYFNEARDSRMKKLKEYFSD